MIRPSDSKDSRGALPRYAAEHEVGTAARLPPFPGGSLGTGRQRGSPPSTNPRLDRYQAGAARTWAGMVLGRVGSR
jgi:hypothetical protein